MCLTGDQAVHWGMAGHAATGGRRAIRKLMYGSRRSIGMCLTGDQAVHWGMAGHAAG